MRFTGRLLATCSAAAIAVLCSVAAGMSDAQAARPQGQEARPARAAAPAPVAPRAGMPQPGSRLQAAQAGAQKQRVQNRPALKATNNPKAAKARLAAASAVNVQHWGGISCVPFARAATGMAVKGNAHAWWDSAAGTYERGFRPEAGSILTFRSTQRMRLGHVSVVARVIDSRTVEVDHANWAGPGGQGKGRVARGVPVIDVSERNDWSAVQVALPGGGFGSVYPTYGFIYDRPDSGMMVANNMARPHGGQGAPRYSEVADAWNTRVLPAGSTTFAADAPQRSLR